jgi:flagella basal body P-ring formation protein FlgA
MLPTALLRLLAACATAFAFAGAPARADAPSLEDGYLPVPVVTIYTGDTITDALIEERQFPTAVRVRQAVVEGRAPLIGKIARRTLIAGKPIPINAVVEPMLVTRGVPAQAVFRSGGIFITTVALPVRSGSLGDYVQMRNMDSGQMIAGVVQADGTVLVGGGP